MSNATAARLAEVSARLIAAPFNADLDLAEFVARDVIEFARTSKTSPAKVSAKTIERILAEGAARLAPAHDADMAMGPTDFEPTEADIEADHADQAAASPVRLSWTAYMGNAYGETWDSVICYGANADEAGADAVLRTCKLNGGGWVVHRVEGPHKVASHDISEPVRVVEDDVEVDDDTSCTECGADPGFQSHADDCAIVTKPAAKAPQDDAKRSNFKHDACTHDKTPKARAACRKARAKALNA